MTKYHLIQAFRDKWRKLRSVEGGSVLATFTFAMIPMCALVGASVDYSRASAARSAMQAAVDSTALAISKTAASQTADQLQSAALTYFNALFTRKDAQNVQLAASYDAITGSSVTVSASATVKTDFMGIMGFSQIPIAASSFTKWGNSRLRVALVLDNTGSMSQASKMTALKTASHNLLTQLKTAASKNSDVYVSIIPFSKDVNVNPVNYNQSWVRWDLWDAANGTCSISNRRTQSSCTANGGTWTADNHNTWNGCVTDRDQNYDTTNTAPSIAITETLFPAEQYDSCPVPLMGLSYDWTALNNKIDAMQPAGYTNQAIGLQWGFQSLTNAPFTIPPFDANYKYQQVIILLTDGLNTKDRWYTSQSSIDARQKITCDNVKAAGITLYTVQVNTDGDPTSTLLQYCASDSSKFFLLTSANQIVTTFNQIGTALSQLRIAK